MIKTMLVSGLGAIVLMIVLGGVTHLADLHSVPVDKRPLWVNSIHGLAIVGCMIFFVSMVGSIYQLRRK